MLKHLKAKENLYRDLIVSCENKISKIQAKLELYDPKVETWQFQLLTAMLDEEMKHLSRAKDLLGDVEWTQEQRDIK